MCHVTLGHGGVQGGTRPEKVASPNIFHRSRSLRFNSPSKLQAPPTSLCLVRQVPGQLHQLSPYTLSSACMATTLPQTTWHLLPYYPTTPGHMVEKTLLYQTTRILNAQPGTSYVTSNPAPPMMCYFCQFPHIFYLLSDAIFTQGKSSP